VRSDRRRPAPDIRNSPSLQGEGGCPANRDAGMAQTAALLEQLKISLVQSVPLGRLGTRSARPNVRRRCAANRRRNGRVCSRRAGP
jgi:hypothetical protein